MHLDDQRKRVNQPVLDEKSLKLDEFKAKLGGELGAPGKNIFFWTETWPFRVISNYDGSEVVEMQRMHSDSKFKNKTCPNAIAAYGKFEGGVEIAN